jgi:CheY-like chemotaxis protein
MRDLTVLYIEDNATNARLVEKILVRRPGAELRLAPTGAAGIDQAEQHQPDVILLDLHLPDIAGETVLERLRSNPKTADIPVIIVSADASPSHIERLLAHGAAHYLTKPFDVREFLTVIEDAPRGVSRSDSAPTPTHTGDAPLDASVLDDLRALAQADGIGDLLAAFEEANGTGIDRLRDAIAAGDDITVRELAHRLRGTSAALGAARLAELYRGLEDRDNAAAGPTTAALAGITAEYHEVREALRAAFPGV